MASRRFPTSAHRDPGGSVTAALPDLSTYDAVLFDLDGVLTPTAEVHMHAWQTMFEELFAAWDITPPYTERDYFEYLDGKKRYDGVASLLRSRDVEVPWGDPSDPPTADTVCGIGNRKNVVFSGVLRSEGISAYPGSVRLLDALQAAGTPIAVVSSSKNATEVLQVAGLTDRFPVQARPRCLRRGGSAGRRRTGTRRSRRGRHLGRHVGSRWRLRTRHRCRPRRRCRRVAEGRCPPRGRRPRRTRALIFSLTPFPCWTRAKEHSPS